jgi:hypothetical protein
MGLDHALCAIVPASRAHGLLPALARVLDAASRQELDGLSLQALAAGASRCLALHVQLEADLGALFDAPAPDCIAAPGSLGCLWTTVHVGEHWVLLQLAAATSSLSAALQLSGQVQDRWRAFARDAGAALAYLDLDGGDLEGGAARCLFPDDRPLALPGPVGERFDVDAWCARLLGAESP